MRKFLLIGLLLCTTAACRDNNNASNRSTNVNASANNVSVNSEKNASSPTPNVASIPVYTYEIVNTYKHDSNAFTEGLFYREGFLYESVGKERESDLRKVDLRTGEVRQRRKMDSQYFGEGTTELNGKIYQMTWTHGKCFV